MLKLTGGRWRGRTLLSQTAGPELRPTTGLVRESWFNRVQFQLNNARFLDLFAGTGLMGLEALSRGAGFVCAVEHNARHAAGIRQNFDRFGLAPSQAQVLQKDVLAWLQQSPQTYKLEPFDLIYMDPPYAYPHYTDTVACLMQNGWLNQEGLLGIESNQALEFADETAGGWQRVSKAYGDTMLTLLAYC